MEKIQLKLSHLCVPLEAPQNPGAIDPGYNNNNVAKQNLMHFRTDELMVLDKIEEMAHAETPTDVGDIHF